MEPLYFELQNGEIRLIELFPGTYSQPIVCQLQHVKFDCNPKYEALSYEWKKHEGEGLLKCRASEIKITLNLQMALRSLRYARASRILWVDAICINQDDETEKAKQIAIMGNIYKKADSVIVWLGNEVPQTRTAFDVLSSLAFIWVERARGINEEKVVQEILPKRPKDVSLFKSKSDICWTLPSLKYAKPYLLQRKLNMRDDEIFQFKNARLWKEIDDIFGNTYFERSWIIQEVAVADVAYVKRGGFQIPWGIFQAAHGGRTIFNFQKSSNNQDPFGAPLLCVKDARRRYKNPTLASDLAAVLSTFTYSKETDSRDHIYAALGLVKSKGRENYITTPDYSKTTEEVFYDAAVDIINERQDLYHWGVKSLLSNRTLENLPSWVPEWNGITCERGAEYFSHTLSHCIPGHPKICGQSLYVNAHILDQIECVTDVQDDYQMMELVVKLNHFLTQPDSKRSGLFEPYVGNLPSSHNSKLSIFTPNDLQLENLAEVVDILCTYGIPRSMLITLLQGFSSAVTHPLDNTTLNLEALWSVLTPISRIRLPSPVPTGQRLFLATLYLSPLLFTMPKHITGSMQDPAVLPKGYATWVSAATIAMKSDTYRDTFLSKLYFPHICRSNLDDECFFFTKNGYFGRGPVGNLKKGQYVTIIGGAYVPYIVEKHENHYVLVSHSYIEGIMEWQTLPEGRKVKRIELR